MRRKIWFGSAVLLAIAAVESGLLRAGAAEITGRHRHRDRRARRAGR
jgi:hypothetical protein